LYKTEHLKSEVGLFSFGGRISVFSTVVKPAVTPKHFHGGKASGAWGWPFTCI